ncbi:magnesium transporter CorA family protein [bacterium]|nr:magnesium transporter CorA family protein [bacterium]
MITIYKTTLAVLEGIQEFEADSWVNVVNPTYEELERLSHELAVPLDILTDPLDIDERSRCEAEDNATLVIARIPVADDTSQDIPFFTIPLGILVGEHHIVTICRKDNDVMHDFMNGKVRNFSTANRTRFLLQIFLRTALLYLRDLKEINTSANIVQEKLHRAMENRQLIKLLSLQKSLVYFTTSLRSNELMLERLQKLPFLRFSEEQIELLDDVIVENKQAIEMANIYNNILTGMMDAFASIISNNVGAVVKLLTSITIVLALPTLIASIYGMNVKLPFVRNLEDPVAFWIVMGIAFGMTIGLVYYFIRRRWF